MEKPIDKNVHKGHRERVRKKFMNDGFDSFEEHEVLEMLLFYCYPLKDTNEIAHKLIRKFGSLSVLLEASPQEIMKTCKVTENVACLVSMVPHLARKYYLSKWDKKEILDSSDKAGLFMVSIFTGMTIECFYLICLNNKKGLINAIKLFEGTVTETAIYPREIVAAALKYNATYVILAHNHPSGIVAPSRSDIVATDKIVAALNTVDIEVVDHIIVAGGTYYSFNEKKTTAHWY